MSGGPPAGWHPDPWQPGQQRWWDGTTWTGYAAPGPGGALRLDEEERLAARARVALLAIIPLALVSQAALVWMVRIFVDRWNEVTLGTSSSTPFGPGFTSDFLGPRVLTQVGGLGNLVAGILFLLWFHRACTDACALGLPTRRDPGLATASFVIPVVNLWWPYQSTCDLLPPGHAARPHVLRWWLLWVVGGTVASTIVMVGAAVSVVLGSVLLVVPAVQVVAAALAARRVVADVGDAHRSMAGAAVAP